MKCTLYRFGRFALILTFACGFSGLAYAATTCHASWYECCNSHTADGTPFNPEDPQIAAHRYLPFGTELLVTNLKNGRSRKVTINDRGPFIEGRCLDLTRAAARQLGFLHDGSVKIKMEEIN